MAKLPADISGQDLRRALRSVGFILTRQRGSHMILRRDNPRARAVVPDTRLFAPALCIRLLRCRISPLTICCMYYRAPAAKIDPLIAYKIRVPTEQNPTT